MFSNCSSCANYNWYQCYLPYYDYNYNLSFLYTSDSRWFFTRVWVLVSLHKSSVLFSIFWPVLTVLSPIVFLFPILLVPFINSLVTVPCCRQDGLHSCFYFQFSRILLSILDDLYKTLVWIISPRPLTSKSLLSFLLFTHLSFSHQR